MNFVRSVGWLRRLLPLALLTGAISFVPVATGPTSTAVASGSCAISSNDAQYRFIAIPGDVASKQSNIEVRLGIKNTGSVSQTWTVNFYVDTITPSLKLNVSPILVTIGASAHGLANVVWNPISFPGAHNLLYQATVGGVTTDNSASPWPIKILDVTTKAPSYFGGTWVEPGQLLQDPAVSQNASAGVAYVNARVDEMHTLGIGTIIIAYSEFVGINIGPFYNSSLSYLNSTDPAKIPAFDVVGTILHQACLDGMHVIVGLGRGPQTWLNLDQIPAETQARMDQTASFEHDLANDLYNKYGINDYYGANNGTFYGWYNAYEANTYDNAKYFYDKVALDLHNSFGPEKAVLIAPAGSPTGISTATLNSSQSDIFAYQEAVGTGYVGPGATCLPGCGAAYTYTWNPYNRINDLSTIFSQYAGWHSTTNKHIWADTELWQMDGPSYNNPYTALCQRVRDQIEPERNYTSMLTAYDFFGPMKSPANTNTLIPYTNASQMYSGYKAYYDAGQPNMTGATRLCTP